MGVIALDATGLMPWLAIGNILVSALVGLLVWTFTSGRYTQKQESGQQSVAERVSKIEADLKDEHNLRRDVNQAVGKLTTKVAVLETKVTEHERRIDRVERGGAEP